MDLPAAVLLREIRERGYNGGLMQLKMWLASMKGSSAAEPMVRFGTSPGEQLQVDFTWIRKEREPLVAFAATLGYSRASYVHFSAREDSAALLTGLCEALDYFGGVPQHVLLDNPKTVVIERDAWGPGCHRWHAGLLTLAEQQCGFALRPCRPYRAKIKGKIERFNQYLKASFVVLLVASLCGAGTASHRRAGSHAGRACPAGATAPMPVRVAILTESLQYSLAVYEQLLEVTP